MIGNNLGLIELTLSGALGLGFCLYQYVAIRRDIARSRRERPEAAERPDSTERDASARGAGHPHGEHRLDDR